MWSSINANYLPPSGASLVHPHLQSAHDDCGLTGQRTLVEQSRAWQERHGPYWAALVDQEAGGPRWVGHTGRVAWLTPFAPIGFHEVWGVVSGAADVTDLTDEDGQALGQGLSQVLAAYKDWNLASFNFGVIGGGPQAREHGHQVVLKVVSRSNPEPMYRSDATYFERLHGEAMIDLSPEEIADGPGPGSDPARLLVRSRQRGVVARLPLDPVPLRRGTSARPSARYRTASACPRA